MLNWRLMGIRFKQSRCVHIFFLSFLGCFLYISGFHEYTFQIPFMFYSYPLDVDLHKVIHNVKAGRPAGVEEINKYNYRRIITNDKKCQDKDIFLLLVVRSAGKHFARRGFIRKTWGKERLVLGRKVVTVFTMGQHSGDIILQKNIVEEHNQFHDIIQDAYEDSYWNLTIKQMQGFHWATENCRHASYLMLADDDYYISPENLVKYLISLQGKNVISGYVWDKSVPLRCKWSKFYTPLSEYPYWYWPPYVSGGTITLTMNTAVDITIAIHYTKYLRFEDIFLGIIALKMGIPVQHDSRFYVTKLPYSKEKFRDVISSHGYYTDELLILWRLKHAEIPV